MSVARHLDPVDLDGVRRALGLDEPGSGLHPILMRRIEIGPDALDRLPAIVDALRRPGPLAVLADRRAMRRGTTDLKPDIVRRLGALGEVVPVAVGDDGAELHADAAAIDAARRLAAGAGILVSVGSGTICDIGKEASRELGIPYVVVQTANSVNAFADDMAVLLVRGVKRTLPSRWPDALVIDLRTLADAPAALNRAGVGELMAMFTAPADWRLASAFGQDPTFDPRVVTLFRDGAPALLEAAPRLASGDLAVHRSLAELMTLSGLALGVAGRTAPISGTEHTVSHLLDMAAGPTARVTRLHGAQVGVASLVVAVLWDRLLASLDPAALLSTPVPDAARMQARIEAAFATLDPTGGMADECWREYREKLEAWESRRAIRESAVRGWGDLVAELRALLVPPGEIAAALRSAGAPATFEELDPPSSAVEGSWALFNGHLMRSRFSIADLAWFADAWTPELVAEAIEEARRIAAAVGHHADRAPSTPAATMAAER